MSARRTTTLEQLDPRIQRCDCGRVTTFRCTELWYAPGLAPCNGPLCSARCELHRHQPNTMGYPKWEGRADYCGEAPDGPGFFPWLKSIYRLFFWPQRKKAQFIWDGIRKKFKPPSPLPVKFLLNFGGTVYESDGPVMRLQTAVPVTPAAKENK